MWYYKGASRIIQMAVKVDNSHRAVGLVDAPEQREGDGVVTTEGDDTWQRAAGAGNALVMSGCVGLTHEEVVVAFFNLLNGPGIVVSRDFLR